MAKYINLDNLKEYHTKATIEVDNKLSNKQDTLEAGENITIQGNIISANPEPMTLIYKGEIKPNTTYQPGDVVYSRSQTEDATRVDYAPLSLYNFYVCVKETTTDNDPILPIYQLRDPSTWATFNNINCMTQYITLDRYGGGTRNYLLSTAIPQSVVSTRRFTTPNLLEDSPYYEYNEDYTNGNWYMPKLKLINNSPVDDDDAVAKKYVDDVVATINSLKLKVVESLPTTDISTTTIYLVPKTTTGTQDSYDEFIYVDSKWEHIGSTEVDLTDYAKKSELPTKVSELENDEGYLKEYTETDPTVPAHVKAITEEDIAKWNEGGGSSETVSYLCNLANHTNQNTAFDITDLDVGTYLINYVRNDAIPASLYSTIFYIKATKNGVTSYKIISLKNCNPNYTTFKLVILKTVADATTYPSFATFIQQGFDPTKDSTYYSYEVVNYNNYISFKTDNTLYISESTNGYRPVTVDGNERLYGVKSFANAPRLLFDTDPELDTQFVTKKYVDNNKGPTYTAGNNITIENNVISATGGSSPFEEITTRVTLNDLGYDGDVHTYFVTGDGQLTIKSKTGKKLKTCYQGAIVTAYNDEASTPGEYSVQCTVLDDEGIRRFETDETAPTSKGYIEVPIGQTYKAGNGIAISDDGTISCTFADGDEVSY